MARFVELLQLSPTMSEGTLVKWRFKEGDDIKAGEMIAEVETDKAVMDHETLEGGHILKLLVKEGERLPVGKPIAIVGKKGEDISGMLAGGGAPAPAAPPPPAEATAPAPAPKPAAPAPAPKPAAPAPKPAPAPAAKPAAVAVAAPARPAAARSNGGRVFVSPLARRMAADGGVDLAALQGSGPGGRIIKRDVEAALAAPAPAATAAAAPAGEVTEIPISSVRRIIAQRLVESKVTVPHFQLDVVVRAERILEALERMKAAYPDTKITMTHFLVKAMAVLAMRHQPIRTQWADTHLRVLPGAHISVAVATDDGLVVPVLRDVHAKSMLQIARELGELVGRARERRLKPEEMTGGVQTLSNLGMFPIHFFTAIINPPESSILAVGTTEDRVFVENGEIKPGKAFTITMSCDHRVIDGAVGAAYLKDLKAALEEPLLLL
jgi:pyruvate dehydrogenase E2 component (dihydrolipoamide acetyltransferase)